MAYQNYRPPYPPAPPAGGYQHHQSPPPQPQSHPYSHSHSHPPSSSASDPFRLYYADRLRQLTFNSKPLIQELSVMAMQQRDGNLWDGMQAVVEEIETAVLRAPPPSKLPLLYLIDSISKNVGAPYTTHLLPPIIPRLYVKTYREVDGHTKSRLDEVIKLWGHTGPNNSPLYGPGVMEAVTSQIYGPASSSAMAGPSRQQVSDLLNTTLAAKRREIQFNPAVHGQLAILSQIGEVVNTQTISSLELAQIMEQLKSMMPPMPAPTPPPPMPSPYPPPNQNHYGQMPPQGRPPFPPGPPAPSNLPPFPPNGQSNNAYRSTPPPPQNSHLHAHAFPPQHTRESSSTPQPSSSGGPPLPLDVAKLLQTINAGSLSQNRTPEPKTAMEAYEDLIMGMNVKLVISDINTPRSLPHSQLPDRCRNCGIRMPHDEEKMKAHMDWHFRRNRKEREGQGRGAHRKWLPKADEWANEEPQAGPSKGGGGRDSTPASGPKLTAAKLAQLKKRWVRVPQDPIKKAQPCPVCKELFKPEWAEEEEEWVYRNAIDISGSIYHATCRAEQMSLTKLMKEEGKRSKSASPSAKVDPGLEAAGGGGAVKMEKRKPEEEMEEEETSKRARIAEQEGNGVEEAAPRAVTLDPPTKGDVALAHNDLDAVAVKQEIMEDQSEGVNGGGTGEDVVSLPMLSSGDRVDEGM